MVSSSLPHPFHLICSAQRSNLCSKSEEEEGEVPLSSRMQDVKVRRTRRREQGHAAARACIQFRR